MNNFQIDIAFKNSKNDVWYFKKGSIYFKGNEKVTINGLHAVSLHFIDFISWGVLVIGPLYCITLW
jgi:hypothetical protein